jgi:hypothetical protein
MINKEKITNFIPHYYLGGKIEHVLWEISNNTIIVNFVDDSRTVVGKIVVEDIPFDTGTYGIFNTSQLIKMLNILDEDILVEVIKHHNVAHKFKFSDRSVDIQFSLADESVIPKAPEIKIDEFDITSTLDKETILKFIKSKDSIAESSLLTITTDNILGTPSLLLTLGNNTSGANKITLTTGANISKEIQSPLPFNSDNLKEILKANKESDFAKLSINILGLIKLDCKKDNITSTYYISREN